MSSRSFAADDFDAIRSRLEELKGNSTTQLKESSIGSTFKYARVCCCHMRHQGYALCSAVQGTTCNYFHGNNHPEYLKT